jgi:sterol 24-C-methyltransferase
MSIMHTDLQRKIIRYYTKKESRWGYSILLKGIRHFGYYPEGMEAISMKHAQILMIEKLAEKLSIQPDSLLLDAGCGEGFVAMYLANKYALHVHGVDLLDVSIEKANKSLDSILKKQITFQVMDYTSLDFPDETFDAVYTMETLVHAPDCLRALQEFHRVLKPHGKLVLFEYSLRPFSDPPSDEENTWKLIIEESGMHSLPSFQHGTFPQLLQQTGFIMSSVENISLRVLPMLRKFEALSTIPFQIVKLLGLQRNFVNVVSAKVGTTSLQNDLIRYNIVTATKAR